MCNHRKGDIVDVILTGNETAYTGIQPPGSYVKAEIVKGSNDNSGYLVRFLGKGKTAATEFVSSFQVDDRQVMMPLI